MGEAEDDSRQNVMIGFSYLIVFMRIELITKTESENTHRANPELGTAIPLATHTDTHQCNLSQHADKEIIINTAMLFKAEPETQIRVAGHDFLVDPRETESRHNMEQMGMVVPINNAGWTVIDRSIKAAVGQVGPNPEPLGHTIRITHSEGERRPSDTLVLVVRGEPTIWVMVFVPRVRKQIWEIVGNGGSHHRVAHGEMHLMPEQLIG